MLPYRPVFRIRGESIRADRQETLFLDDVALTLYDEQGRSYHVESREASFNRTTSEETRGHGTHSLPAVWGSHLEAFLKVLAP